jgi:hypothetical protein
MLFLQAMLQRLNPYVARRTAKHLIQSLPSCQANCCSQLSQHQIFTFFAHPPETKMFQFCFSMRGLIVLEYL